MSQPINALLQEIIAENSGYTQNSARECVSRKH